MSGRVFIYVLKDPRTDLVRYVGKTVDLKWRLRSHLDRRELRQYPCPRASWILSLLGMGITPVMEVIEECSPGEVDAREKHWIAHYRGIVRLTNMTEGGDGGATMTGRKNPCSEEKRLKISASKKGRRSTLSAEQRSLLGQKIAESRRRNGTTNKGRTWNFSPVALSRFKGYAQERVQTESGRSQILRAAKISADRNRGKKNPAHSERMKALHLAKITKV